MENVKFEFFLLEIVKRAREHSGFYPSTVATCLSRKFHSFRLVVPSTF